MSRESEEKKKDDEIHPDEFWKGCGCYRRILLNRNYSQSIYSGKPYPDTASNVSSSTKSHAGTTFRSRLKKKIVKNHLVTLVG